MKRRAQALDMFRPDELERLVCGNPVLDFEALEGVTHYEDGFTDESQTVKFFWNVVHRLEETVRSLVLVLQCGWSLLGNLCTS